MGGQGVTADILILIALGIGYIVLYFAKREEKAMQFLGYIIGCITILISTLFLTGILYSRSKVLYRDLQCRREMIMQEDMLEHKKFMKRQPSQSPQPSQPPAQNP